MGNKKCIRDMPAPVYGAYVSRCLLAVTVKIGSTDDCRANAMLSLLKEE